MGLFRLMIVDDEDRLREGLVRRIDWEASGFAVVGQAENGQAGLELSERLAPDVIITDIKMPFMDGLEMSRRILEKQPGVKIIVLSGFDDFEYAQEALALGTVEYILKPISADELVRTLEKVRVRLTDELQEKRSVERLREHYRRSLPVLREQQLGRLLEKRRAASEPIEDECRRLGLDLEAGCYVVSYIMAERQGSGLGETEELIPVSLRELTETQLAARGIRFQCVMRGDSVGVIALLDGEEGVPVLLETLDSVCSLGKHYFGLTVTAGVGLPVGSIRELYRSAQGVRDALDYRVLVGGGRAIFIRDIEPDPDARFAFDEQELQTLLSAIKLGKGDEIGASVTRMVRRLSDSRVPVGLYKFYVMAVVTELVKLMQVYQLGFEQARTDALLESPSPDELIRRLTELCTGISSSIHREHTNSVKSLAVDAQRYVSAHFGDQELSAERVSETLHVSASYFSTVFKRETGETFVSYLSRVRMERAAELLRTTDLKTYAIASEIGLSDPNYFSYVFKKYFGVSPSKYREGGVGA